jgi:four helix bundle protein
MKEYRDLKIWERSHALTLEIYRATKSFPKDELYGLTSQIRRAAASVPTNIAEGCGRDGDAELKRFLNIALGSACELDYLTLLASELQFLDAENGRRLATEIIEVRRMLGSFIQKLKA